MPPSSRFNVELRAGSGRHFAVIGSSGKGAVDRRWPAWDLISHFLDYFFGVEMIFSKLEAKAFYLGN